MNRRRARSKGKSILANGLAMRVFRLRPLHLLLAWNRMDYRECQELKGMLMVSLREQVDNAVRDAASRAIGSGAHRRYIGDNSTRLQDDLSQLLGGAQVLLANSGTSALELALKSIGVSPSDEIILSAYDYPGNFWVIEQLQCTPVLIDVSPESVDVNIDALEAARSSKTKACIVSHLHGRIQQVDQIRRWADDCSITLIEDACQALGARIQHRPTTSYGHLATLSFGGSKVISAGRGGALVTDSERLFQRAKIASGAGSGAYALSELSAAIVAEQLKYLSRINARCCNYFSDVEQLIPKELPRTFLGTIVSNEPATIEKDGENSFANAYYQAGWIFENPAQASALAKLLCEKGITAGSGFPGFHRRSVRRCRTVGTLNNTAGIVDRLLVIHHSVAIDERFSAQQLSALIAEGLTTNGSKHGLVS